jgi:hypothetical protein
MKTKFLSKMLVMKSLVDDSLINGERRELRLGKLKLIEIKKMILLLNIIFFLNLSCINLNNENAIEKSKNYIQLIEKKNYTFFSKSISEMDSSRLNAISNFIRVNNRKNNLNYSIKLKSNLMIIILVKYIDKDALFEKNLIEFAFVKDNIGNIELLNFSYYGIPIDKKLKDSLNYSIDTMALDLINNFNKMNR